MVTTVHFLIIAAGVEADAMGRAARVAGWTPAVAASPAAALEWLSAARADAVLVATGPGVPHAIELLRTLRSRLLSPALHGLPSPLVAICDPAEQALIEGLVDVVVTRPFAADQIFLRLRTVDLPSRLTGGLEARIDDTFDAELDGVIRTGADSNADEFAVGAHKTSEIPRELVDSILAAASEDETPGRPEDSSAAGPSDERAVLEKGDLVAQDLCTLMGRIYSDGLTGCLTLEQAGSQKSVFFEAGRAVLAASSVTSDRMIEMLVRQGKLSRAQYESAMQAALATGRRMGALLIDLGIMKTDELLPAVRAHYEEIVISLFAWTQGHWSFEGGAVADPRRVRLLRHPAVLVNEGLRRAGSLERMRAQLGTPDVILRLETRGAAADVLLELGDTIAEQRMVLLFDGARSVAEIVRESAAGEETIWRVACTAKAFGVLVPVGNETDADGLRSRGQGQPLRDQEIERERIMSRYTMVQEGTYFQILGVSRSAGVTEIRRAAESLELQLRPESVGPLLARELNREISSIRCAIAEGLRILGSDRWRAQYRAHLAPEAAAETSGPRGRPV